MIRYFTRYSPVFILIAVVILICSGQSYVEMKQSTPFEKRLAPLDRPETLVDDAIEPLEQKPPIESVYVNPDSKRESYVYKPKIAFSLVVTRDRYPEILPDKGVYGVITLRVTPDYKATSNVIYAKKKYRFDRLSWAIKTGWNETIPFLSRMQAFKKYLKPFNEPVYAHFYINGVQEYPEYPGQYYHLPREALEDYYLYILQKIDSVASQN